METPVLSIDQFGEQQVVMLEKRWKSEPASWWLTGYSAGEVFPSYWMPLPTPPQGINPYKYYQDD